MFGGNNARSSCSRVDVLGFCRHHTGKERLVKKYVLVQRRTAVRYFKCVYLFINTKYIFFSDIRFRKACTDELRNKYAFLFMI